jgi:cellulose synthase (UDP-forming)
VTPAQTTDPPAGLTAHSARQERQDPWRVGFVAPPDRPGVRWVLFVYVPLAVAYLVWLAAAVRWSAWSGPVMYTVISCDALTNIAFLWMTRTILVPVHRPTSLDRIVDAVITTRSEPVSVVEQTIRGALAVNGIRDVLVLDDGDRPELAVLADRLGAIHLARRDNRDAKAGNLNFGLCHTDAEFLLILDADHAPRPEFLERTLGYLDDPSVAVVQTPQAYHNDSFLFRRTRRGDWSANDMFYKCIQPAKNRTNAAFFVGTSAVLRRRAIDSVDGFATTTATEDIHTALRMHARGWKSIFVPEVLASGLEVESLRELYHQRRRWAAGSMGLLLRSSDSPLRTRGLTIGQRVSYISSMLGHQQGTQRLAVQLLPIACSLTLTAPFTGRPAVFMAVTSLFVALNWFAVWMHARGTFHPLHTEGSQLATCFSNIAGLFSAFMPHERFRPTRKNAVRNERTLVKVALWALVAVAIAALVRDADIFLIAGGPNRPLAIGCAVFIAINLVVLLDFLVPLQAYERREAGAAARRPARPRPTPVSSTPDSPLLARIARPRSRRAALAALVVPILAAGAGLAPAAISDGQGLLTPGARTQTVGFLAPDLVRLERQHPPTSQTCGHNADGFGPRLVVLGLPYLSCARFPESVSSEAVQPGPLLG